MSQLLIYNVSGDIPNSSKVAVRATRLSQGLPAPQSPRALPSHRRERKLGVMGTQAAGAVTAAGLGCHHVLSLPPSRAPQRSPAAPSPLSTWRWHQPAPAPGAGEQPGLGPGALLPAVWLYDPCLLRALSYGSPTLQFGFWPTGITGLCQLLKDAVFTDVYEAHFDPAVGGALKCQEVVVYTVTFRNKCLHTAFGTGIRARNSVLSFC